MPARLLSIVRLLASILVAVGLLSSGVPGQAAPYAHAHVAGFGLAGAHCTMPGAATDHAGTLPTTVPAACCVGSTCVATLPARITALGGRIIAAPVQYWALVGMGVGIRSTPAVDPPIARIQAAA